MSWQKSPKDASATSKENISGGRTPKMIELGEIRAPLVKFKLVYVTMSRYQTQGYSAQTGEEFSVQKKEASLWVWPPLDGSQRPPISSEGAKFWTSRGRLTRDAISEKE